MDNNSFNTLKTAFKVATAADSGELPEGFSFAYYVATIVMATPGFATVLKPGTDDLAELADDCYDYIERTVYSCTDEQKKEIEELVGDRLF